MKTFHIINLSLQLVTLSACNKAKQQPDAAAIEQGKQEDYQARQKSKDTEEMRAATEKIMRLVIEVRAMLREDGDVRSDKLANSMGRSWKDKSNELDAIRDSIPFSHPLRDAFTRLSISLKSSGGKWIDVEYEREHAHIFEPGAKEDIARLTGLCDDVVDLAKTIIPTEM